MRGSYARMILPAREQDTICKECLFCVSRSHAVARLNLRAPSFFSFWSHTDGTMSAVVPPLEADGAPWSHEVIGAIVSRPLFLLNLL